MAFILVGVVQTIVVAIADVNSRNAVAVVARKQITEARSTLGLAVTGWLVTSVQTVVVSIAVPGSRDTPVVDARIFASFFYFILAIITSCPICEQYAYARRGVCSIKLRYDQVRESRRLIAGNVGTFLHSIGASLAESFNLVSNVWHVEIVTYQGALTCLSYFYV